MSYSYNLTGLKNKTIKQKTTKQIYRPEQYV